MSRGKARAKGAPPVGVGGKVLGTLFLLVFFAAGAFFLVILVKELAAAAQTYLWPRTPCELLASEVQERLEEDDPYVFHVQYRYLWEGQTHTSEQAALKVRRFSDYRQAHQLVTRYPVGGEALCYVNPKDPTQAVLFREGLWFGVFLALPLMFMLFAAGGIYFIWRSSPDLESAARLEKPTKPLSQQAKPTKKWGCLTVFFLLFFLAGSAFFYHFLLWPVGKILSAGQWVETPCVVESSRVRTHRGDESTTYSLDILYHYVFNDREYKSSRYHFLEGSSSGYQSKAAIVRLYPPGRESVCYVNPKDPTEAVLNRGFSARLWLGLIPLAFMVVGAGGLFFTLAKSRQDRINRAGAWSRSGGSGGGAALRWTSPEGAGSPHGLRTRHSLWRKLLGMVGAIFIAAFWNGIVSMFVWQVIKAWQEGKDSWMEKWFLPVFLIPFVLIGLVLIGMVFYTFLGLFNPRLWLVVSSNQLKPGDDLEVQWHFNGRVQVLRRVRIYLQGREEATYTRGTDTRTDKAVFATIELANTAAPANFRNGRARLTIPADTVPTFEAPHNKILWTIHVQGEIRRWPDVLEEFPLPILPPQPPNPRPA